ncbi:hypothetical protein J1N35_005117 [Gossypium stocksii]|uniref:Uncharacterized protein n=1 Tax=Gossypium stocksii TaxID=47602 RepID=A0A9D3WE15_9ROSI|nr:hypothetical protein J1N35_005117 [Gossypium stocksii]
MAECANTLKKKTKAQEDAKFREENRKLIRQIEAREVLLTKELDTLVNTKKLVETKLLLEKFNTGNNKLDKIFYLGRTDPRKSGPIFINNGKDIMESSTMFMKASKQNEIGECSPKVMVIKIDKKWLSGHMIGNQSFLVDFEDCLGGRVTLDALGLPRLNNVLLVGGLKTNLGEALESTTSPDIRATKANSHGSVRPNADKVLVVRDMFYYVWMTTYDTLGIESIKGNLTPSQMMVNSAYRVYTKRIQNVIESINIVIDDEGHVEAIKVVS